MIASAERSASRKKRHRSEKGSGIWFWFQPHCGECGWIGEESRDLRDLEDAVLQLNEHVNDAHVPGDATLLEKSPAVEKGPGVNEAVTGAR